MYIYKNYFYIYDVLNIEQGHEKWVNNPIKSVEIQTIKLNIFLYKCKKNIFFYKLGTIFDI